jgi:diadenosine tetraphosphatase ApaH/serine/threonine PP2A family protein phosphatase
MDRILKYLVLSDIHANLEALDATLSAASGYDQVLVLGDLVGYGADPNAVIDRVRELPLAALIRGNHDKVAAGIEGTEDFNFVARAAVIWTATALTQPNLEWLTALPAGPLAVDDLIEICHGTPSDEDVYVFDDMDAFQSIHASQRPLCLYGHTHVPAVFRLIEGSAPGDSHRDPSLDLLGPTGGPRFTVQIEADARFLVNCGAVGQPRDGDPRAAYGIVDADARLLTIFRVEYDIPEAQRKILAAGLPEVLARRLAVGR